MTEFKNNGQENTTKFQPETESMNIHLKRAGIKDIPDLISLERSVSGSKLYLPTLTEEEWLKDLNKNETYTYFVEKDNDVVGKIYYEMKSPSHAHIGGFAVNPSFQGRGIGRKTMEIILNKLKNVQGIDLVVHPDNFKVLKLYESLGFVIQSRIENYAGDGEPRLKMVLDK